MTAETGNATPAVQRLEISIAVSRRVVGIIRGAPKAPIPRYSIATVWFMPGDSIAMSRNFLTIDEHIARTFGPQMLPKLKKPARRGKGGVPLPSACFQLFGHKVQKFRAIRGGSWGHTGGMGLDGVSFSFGLLLRASVHTRLRTHAE